MNKFSSARACNVPPVFPLFSEICEVCESPSWRETVGVGKPKGRTHQKLSGGGQKHAAGLQRNFPCGLAQLSVIGEAKPRAHVCTCVSQWWRQAGGV